jgi:quercetin dioxygenase-like cupin family protein
MPPVKSFPVLGEQIEILVSSEMTGGQSITLIQISPPGGGPPPHQHVHEDESFYVLEGEYEVLKDGVWVKATAGDALYARRGSMHTFRNVGTSTGRMLVHVVPGAFQAYLEEISPLSVPADMAKLLEISARYGITFAPPPAS